MIVLPGLPLLTSAIGGSPEMEWKASNADFTWASVARCELKVFLGQPA